MSLLGHVSEIVKKVIKKKLITDDELTAAMSKAKQRNEVAAANLQNVLCKIFDQSDCECFPNVLSAKQKNVGNPH